ncbi:peptide chain release factor N(5)-glutamine methyltransferase [Micrococcales bacterium 31B]|nr:peptide chain release factor N(5)-glutamine methyltransferase [Micrococcales bacterium 31B]
MQQAAWRQVLVAAIEQLHAAGVPSPEVDARALIAHALGRDSFHPLAEPSLDAAGFAAFEQRLRPLLERRCAREPLQLIVGTTGFRYLTLEVARGVFVPRPETEVVAGAAIDELHRRAQAGATGLRAADLCSGSGTIAVSVAAECPGVQVFAAEINPLGVELTARNAARARVAVTVAHSDAAAPGLWADLLGTFDVVVSNPPYIPAAALPRDAEVLDYDPHESLFGGGADGLDVPRRIMRKAADLLRPGGLFVMEHADLQGESTRAALGQLTCFDAIATCVDLTGRDRYLVGRRT